MNRSALSAAAQQPGGTIPTICGCCHQLFYARSLSAVWCSDACRRRAGYYRRSGRPIPPKGSKWTQPIRPQLLQPEILNCTDELPASWREASPTAVHAPLAPFAYQGRQIRVISDEQGMQWFVAADLIAILELDRKALERLDEDEKGTATVFTPGGTQSMTTVNESGLYSLILGSRKPEAKRFKRWVTHEVLPAIRRTGSYGVPRREPELPQLPPAAPCIVIQASSYREAAQAWAEALEGAAVGAIRRRFSTVSRPGNSLPAGVHFLPLQA